MTFVELNCTRNDVIAQIFTRDWNLESLVNCSTDMMLADLTDL